jgi:DNA-binding NarL/FixJ family response regulator
VREGLTGRQREIAALAARGSSNKEIAARLVLSVRTVENQLQQAYRKLGITSRSELRSVLEVE